MGDNKTKEWLHNVARVLFLYTIRYVIPYIPRCILYRLADIIGFSRKTSREAAIAREELRKMLGDGPGDDELVSIAAKGISNHKKDLFEIWSFPGLSAGKIRKYAYLEGREHIDKALANGKGAMIAVSHFGSWKMIIAALAYEGYKVNQIGLDPRYFVGEGQSHHHNIIMETEYRSDQSLPANFIYVGKFMRQVYRVLAKNELIIDSFDGFIGTKNLKLDFLNSSLTLALGPIIIAARNSAPLLPTFAVRQDDNRHKIIIHEEIPLNPDVSEEEAVREAAFAYAKLFEGYVSQYPSHYCRTLYDRIRDPQKANMT